jgi:nucleoside-diphosphate-sugar epimerase
MPRRVPNVMFATTYSRIHGITWSSLRLFTVPSPYDRPDVAAFAFATRP